LKARRVPYHAIDIATDEKARRIWTRRSKGKKLPGLVKEGDIMADLETVEEWNEYGEVNQHLGGGAATAAAAAAAPQQPPPAQENINPNPPAFTATLPFRTRGLDPEQTAGVLLPYPHVPKPLLNSSKMRPMPPAVLERLGLNDSPATSAESTPQRETSPLAGIETSKDAAEADADADADADTLPDSPQPTSLSDLDPATGAAEAPSSGLEATTVHPEAAGSAASALRRIGSDSVFAGQTHRGSEISIATEEEIRAVEDNNRIVEEDEESDDEEEDGGLQIGGGGGAGKTSGEKVEVKGARAADAGKAGESVGD